MLSDPDGIAFPGLVTTNIAFRVGISVVASFPGRLTLVVLRELLAFPEGDNGVVCRLVEE